MESLTTSNLQKHTVYAHETPRTKVIRYFNQVEDPEFLSNRENTPIPKQELHNIWNFGKAFMPGTHFVKTITVDPIQSPILGQKIFPGPKSQRPLYDTTSIQCVFHSEDSDILVPNTNIKNPLEDASSRKQVAKEDFDDNQSAYTWSDTNKPEQAKSQTFLSMLIVENIYEKRLRRKMVQDPVTGTININPKKAKSTVKTTKISRKNRVSDLGPLERFESKLIGKSRLSVFILLLTFLH